MEHRAKKSLGQNFLKSKPALKKMVSSGSIAKRDTVLEIGPGKGALTTELLETGAHVIAIEKDDRLIPVLQELFAQQIESGQLQLIHGDAHNENIFVTSTGKLRAIIDFGDAVWSDAHHDFVSYIHAYPELWRFSVRAYEEATGQNLDHRRLVALTILRHLKGLINLWVDKIDKDHVVEKFNYYLGLL